MITIKCQDDAIALLRSLYITNYFFQMKVK